MKTDVIKQEILVVITAFQKEFCKKKRSEGFRVQQGEQLEEACWNGLLHEILGGIIETPASAKKLCIWYIKQGKCLLEIELCDYPQLIDRNLSIEPRSFLPIISQN